MDFNMNTLKKQIEALNETKLNTNEIKQLKQDLKQFDIQLQLSES